MNKQQILNELDALQERMDVLNKLLEDCKYSRWEPKLNEQYYFINAEGLVDTDFYLDDEDITRFKVYNCFKTREEAEQEVEKTLVRRQLEDIARRLNMGERIDWSLTEQAKYYIAYDTVEKVLYCSCNHYNQIAGVVYCLAMNFRKVASQEIGEERLMRYLKGE